MLKETFEKLLTDPKVRYIYNLGGPVWNVDLVDDYIIIVDEDWQSYLEVGDMLDGTVKTDIYRMPDWFGKVMDGDLEPWICACLDKKYVLKEHVKLLMTTNPIQLRKYHDEHANRTMPDTITLSDAKIWYWKILRDTRLCNQIIENHKIVNFKNSAVDFKELVKQQDFESLKSKFYELYNPELTLLKKSTDGLLLQEKMKKWQRK